MKNEEKAVKLFNGVTAVGDDLIEEAGTVPKRKKTAVWRWAAFAASPALRDMLAEALGGFAPYAQRQDSAVYTWNGFEFEVLSALADENMVRVYTRITDLEGRDRLDIHSEAWTSEGPWLDIYVPIKSVDVTGGGGTTSFDRYDAATQTTVAVTTLWGEVTDDLTGAEIRIDTPLNRMDGKSVVKIPLDVEVMPVRTLFKDREVAGVQVEALKISTLGVSIIAPKEEYRPAPALKDAEIRAALDDGTELSEKSYDSTTSYIDPDTDQEYFVLIWNFADPVELDQVSGIYVGDQYFPVK